MDETELLVKKLQEKDVYAFEKLHEMYQDSVTGIAFNIVRDQELAEEITQDVFMKVWNNAASYSSSKGRFFTWILNITRNTAIDRTRLKAFSKKNKNLEVENFVDILEDSTNLEKRTNGIGIKDFVNKLADQCKKLIELIYFRGYTQKEVSETLEMPLGTVKTRNRNCLRELKIKLE